MLEALNKKSNLGLTKPYLSKIMLSEEYEKYYGINSHNPNGSRLQSVAMNPAEEVEETSQLYFYISRFIDLRMSEIIPNLTLEEMFNYPRDIVDELLRKCREAIEAKQKLSDIEHRKAQMRAAKNRNGRT